MKQNNHNKTNIDDPEDLINPGFLAKLETLQIMSKKIITGSSKGERLSTKKGRSLDFADYRNYTPGDEIRIIDWNVYGRLEKLFVKLFAEEEELILYILVDSSLSMSYGKPPKIIPAKQTAAALAYIALSNFDRAAVGVFDETLAKYHAPVRGKNQIFHIFNILKSISPSGQTSLAASLENFTVRKQRPGIVLVISDFLDPGGFKEQLAKIRYQKHELFLLQILDKEEVYPQLGGDLKLLEIETKEFKELTVTDQLLELYQKTVLNYCKEINDFAVSIDAGCLFTLSEVPFDRLVMEYLRSSKLLK